MLNDPVTSLPQEDKLITDTKQKSSVLNQQFQSVFFITKQSKDLNNKTTWKHVN